jgi:hypothetical protein
MQTPRSARRFFCLTLNYVFPVSVTTAISGRQFTRTGRIAQPTPREMNTGSPRSFLLRPDV